MRPKTTLAATASTATSNVSSSCAHRSTNVGTLRFPSCIRDFVKSVSRRNMGLAVPLTLLGTRGWDRKVVSRYNAPNLESNAEMLYLELSGQRRSILFPQWKGARITVRFKMIPMAKALIREFFLVVLNDVISTAQNCWIVIDDIFPWRFGVVKVWTIHCPHVMFFEAVDLGLQWHNPVVVYNDTFLTRVVASEHSLGVFKVSFPVEEISSVKFFNNALVGSGILSDGHVQRMLVIKLTIFLG